MSPILRTLILPFLALICTASWAEHPASFSQAKKLAWGIYADKQETFYCGCDYEDGNVDASKCGYKPRKQPKRGARVEWEHVVPAWEFGHQRQCWQTGGRKNCEDNDQQFEMMEADLHNLVPAVGELNGDRSNFRYGMIEGEPRAYGSCDFEVDFKLDRAEPPANRQGDVARIYFYMRDRYGLKISRQQDQLFTAWSKMDPVDAWEIERDRRITNIQGNSNCYVSGSCTVKAVGTMSIEKPKSSMSCDSGVRYCKQMSSCEEARFYLTQCGLDALDRDKDGVPCESLCK